MYYHSTDEPLLLISSSVTLVTLTFNYNTIVHSNHPVKSLGVLEFLTPPPYYYKVTYSLAYGEAIRLLLG